MSLEVLHDSQVVAELKPGGHRRGVSGRQAVLHDSQVVAELKPDQPVAHPAGGGQVLHDSQVVAELKQADERLVVRRVSGFSTTHRSWPN